MKLLRCRRFTSVHITMGTALGAIIALTLAAAPALAQTPDAKPKAGNPRLSITMPMVNPQRGRKLFVSKGCFMCHSVKGVGSKVAPALDAPSGSTTIDVFAFVARMWNGAAIMSDLQSVELGYRITFNADELADLAGFAGDPKAQEGFSLEEIPELVREWILKDAWWKDPSEADWRKTLPSEFPDLENLDEKMP